MLARSINIQREIQIALYVAEALLLMVAVIIIVRAMMIAPRPIPVQAQDNQTVLVSVADETLFTRAQNSMKQGQFSESVVLLDAAIEIASNPTAEMFATRALAHSRMGQYAEASQDYQQAIARNPNIADYQTGLCYVSAIIRDYEAATRGCDNAVTLQPDNWSVWNERCYYRAYFTGDYAGANSDCTRALTLNPNHPFAYNNRARAYLMQGNYTEALADASNSLSLGNRYPAYPYTTRGTAYAALGNFNQALIEYQAALAINPTYPELHLRLGEWYRYQNQPENARQAYCHYIEYDANPMQYAFDRVAEYGGCG